MTFHASQTLVSFWVQSVGATAQSSSKLSDHMEQGGACVSGHLKMEQNLLDLWKLTPPLRQAGANLYVWSGGDTTIALRSRGFFLVMSEVSHGQVPVPGWCLDWR